jgi:hypothetical protein
VAVAELPSKAGQAWWSAPAHSTGRPLSVPRRNLGPTRSLDRDGERVTVKWLRGGATTDTDIR